MKIDNFLTISTVLFGVISSENCEAALVAASGSGDFASFLNNSTVGWAFTPISDIRVEAVGIVDAGGQGLNGIHVVSIWHAVTQERLSSTNLDRIKLHNTDDNGNVLLPVGDELILNAGEKYVISTRIDYIGEPFYTSRFGTVSFHPELIVDPGRRSPPAGSTEDLFPSESSDFIGTVVGPTFSFTVIPEPSSALLFSIASATFFLRRRR